MLIQVNCLVTAILISTLSVGGAAGDMIALYEFENNLADSSGNGHTGTVAAGNPAYVPGRPDYGDAIRIHVGSSVTWAGLPKPTAMTASIWVKLDPTSPTKSWLLDDMTTVSGLGWRGWQFKLERAGANTLVNWILADNAGIRQTTTGTVPDLYGAWHHLVGTHDGAGTARLYVDGTLVAQKTTSTFAPAPATKTLRLNNIADDQFYGDVDSISIWNRALTAAEVQSLFVGSIYIISVTPGNQTATALEGVSPAPVLESYTVTNKDSSSPRTVTITQVDGAGNAFTYPWLVLSASQLAIPAGGSATLSATIDHVSTGLPVGVHTAYLKFRDDSSTPAELIRRIELSVFADPDVLSPADFDGDGYVDESDLTRFMDCAAGPGLPYAATCTLAPDGAGHVAADFDRDDDIDGNDFAVFQRCIGGPTPAAWWKMDDNAASATATDSSGKGRHGAYWSSSKAIATSLSHYDDRVEGTGSLFFDGVNDRILVGGYKGVTGTAGRTCAAWIKTSSLGQGDILDWGSTAAGTRWLFKIHHGRLRVDVAGGYRQTTATVNDGQWHHVATTLLDDGSPNTTEIKLYIDGVEQTNCTGTAYAINTGNAMDVKIGIASSTYFSGLIDDLRIYKAALSAADIAQLALADRAKFVAPRDGAVDVGINATLNWRAAGGATAHHVYFGTTAPGAYRGSQTGTSYDAGTLATNTRYYWRIDEVIGGNTITGKVWSFTTENHTAIPVAAATPCPPNGEINVWKDVDLRWTGGARATSHKVYFGTNPTLGSAEFKGNQTGTSYALSTLAPSTTYYWRIDEVNNYGTRTGSVWSFTTESGSRLDPDDFVIMAWDPPGYAYTRQHLDTMRACGINVLGFAKAESFDIVGEAGLKAFLANWDALPTTPDMVNLSQSGIDLRVSAAVNSVYQHPALFGFMLRDEPPASEFPGLGNWMDSYRAAAPGYLIYLSLGHPYDWTSLLANVSVQFLSYDHYGMMADGSVWHEYYYNLERARTASISSGLPFWNTVESMKQTSPNNPQWNTATPSPATLRLQAFTSLAYGVKGVSWFIYSGTDPSTYTPVVNSLKTNTWTYLKDVNMAIHRIGPTYLGLTNIQVFHTGGVPSGGRGISSSTYVSSISGGSYCVGEFRDSASKPFLMVVNKSLSSNASLNITLKPAYSGTLYYVDASTGQLQTFTQGRTLLPGEGILLKKP